MRDSEDPQDRVTVALADAFVAAARNELPDALRHVRTVLAEAPSLGIGTFPVQWAWPLAARSAHDLGDIDTVVELLAVLDAHPVGHIPSILRAERLLVRARLAVLDNNEDADGALAAAVAALRQGPSPYHLAHGLLDYAEHLNTIDDHAGSLALVVEARTLAERLHAQPLLDRAERIVPRTNRAEEATVQSSG